MQPEPIYVAVALDVEEEGLFRGRYQCFIPPVTNLSALARLDSLIARGVRPTLFCAYPAVIDPEGRAILQEFENKAELGAHLHYWNTPPLPKDCPDFLNQVPAGQLPLEQFEAKLEVLRNAIAALSGAYPASFRMGRWDLHRPMLPILVSLGFTCDASIRPLHWQMDGGNGPDHFGAPPDPYWIHTKAGAILEVPLTVIPLVPFLQAIPPAFLPRFTQWGALALLAVYHPLWLMKLATSLHIARGGRVLSLTWHSSEMKAGATPHLDNQAKVDAFLNKIGRYLDWLEREYEISYVTMSQLTRLDIFPALSAQKGDFCIGGEDAG